VFEDHLAVNLVTYSLKILIIIFADLPLLTIFFFVPWNQHALTEERRKDELQANQKLKKNWKHVEKTHSSA